MADRLKSLQRIAKVQAEMVKLAEWRIAAAERQIEALAQDRARLVDYVSTTGALGVPMAKAALRSMTVVDRRRDEIERARSAEAERLDGLRRRDRAVAAHADLAAREARRAGERIELAAVMEAWLARPD